jgi:hypothetical protein
MQVDTPKINFRNKIASFQEALLNVDGHMEGDCFPLKHTFATGAYVREIFLPKGSMIVGKLHKHSHPNFLMSGEVSVVTEEGVKRLKGPLSMISPAATKRVVYAHEDTVWITVHMTAETDIEKIEYETIAKDYTELGMAEPVVDNKVLVDLVKSLIGEDMETGK